MKLDNKAGMLAVTALDTLLSLSPKDEAALPINSLVKTPVNESKRFADMCLCFGLKICAKVTQNGENRHFSGIIFVTTPSSVRGVGTVFSAQNKRAADRNLPAG
jgi:hypothetical protein